MATMEKQVKKKKTKVKKKSIEEHLEEYEEFPVASSHFQIETVECAIANLVIGEDTTSTEEPVELAQEVKISAPQEETITSAPPTSEQLINVQPTAPLLEASSSKTLPPKHEQVFYPNLQEMATCEANTQLAKIREQINENAALVLTPFTENELEHLYYNRQIERCEDFELEFIQAELNVNYCTSNSLLYDLLMKYSKSRASMKTIVYEIESLRDEIKKLENTIWYQQINTIKAQKKCNKCTSTYSISKQYNIAFVDQNVLVKLEMDIKSLHEKAFQQYYMFSLAAEMIKLQIDQKLFEITESCPEFIAITTQTPVSCCEHKNLNDKLRDSISELRVAISILFLYIRLPTPDVIFVKDLKNWINKLVGLLLRVASWQDHLFLLFHILRCPNGTAKWAASLLQIPQIVQNSDNVLAAFDDSKINHSLAVIKILMSPIKDRNAFLVYLIENNFDHVLDPVRDDVWTIVDSDGEEGTTPTGEVTGLKENDIVLLLNQIPLEILLGILTMDENSKCKFDDPLVSRHYVLKLIAFFSNFVKILGDGLQTYNTERYRQVAKRIARIIRHTILYAADIVEIFCAQTDNLDIHLKTRVKLEYNTFILRTCQVIYNARFLGTWQYLIDLPFKDLDSTNLWKLYYALNVGFTPNFIHEHCDNIPERIQDDHFVQQFNDISIEVPADDLYYLLQTFGNMIASREKNEWNFIKTAAMWLVEIGFVNKPTKDICYKIVRDILGNITVTHPELISELLSHIRFKMDEIKSSVGYILKTLPLERWHPTPDDFEILAVWLLNYNIELTENSTARAIIANLNWGFDTNDKLFISHEFHLRMACLILQTQTKHLGTAKTCKPQELTVFTNWCWNTAARLRLHLMDQGKAVIQNTIRNPFEMLVLVPELERIDIINQGVTSGNMLALYLSILSSNCGHSIPEICHRGFSFILQLMTEHEVTIAMRCLQLVSPLFFDCSENMRKNAKLQQILTNILAPDRSFLKLAKNLIQNYSPSESVEIFACMIQAQIIDYATFGFTTPTVLVNLWLQILISNSVEWYKNQNITFIMDKIVGIAYQSAESWQNAKILIKEAYPKFTDVKVSKPTGFSLFGTVGSSQYEVVVIPNVHCYLALICFEVEHEVFEIETGIWSELVNGMALGAGKNCCEETIKNISLRFGLNSYTASSLVVYKIASYLLTMDKEHPLIPVMTALFYYLYLTRVFPIDAQQLFDNFGCSSKFFNGNTGLMKRLKKFIGDMEEFYITKSMHEKNEIRIQVYQKCNALFHSYKLWLEEAILDTLDSESVNLPVQYDSKRLAIIFEGNYGHWNEFVYFPAIRVEQKNEALLWNQTCFRHTLPTNNQRQNSITRQEMYGPKERIRQRLKLYDKPLSPPPISKGAAPLKAVRSYNTAYIASSIQQDFRIVQKFTRSLCAELVATQKLEQGYQSLSKKLYENMKKIHYESKKCTNCQVQVNLSVNISEPILNTTVKKLMEENRVQQKALINKQLVTPTAQLSLVHANIHHSINLLLRWYLDAKEKKSGVHDIVEHTKLIVYDVLLKDELEEYKPTTAFIIAAVDKLTVVLRESQDVHLLKMIMRHSDEMATVLYKSFNSMLITPKNYIKMYTFVLDMYVKKKPNIAFVEQALEIFAMKQWLQAQKPRLADISILIEKIMLGLKHWQSQHSEIIQKLLGEQLVDLFEHNHPEHYGEVLQIVLDNMSAQNIAPTTILLLLQSLFVHCDCEPLISGDPKQKCKIIHFANQQKRLSYPEVADTMVLLFQHYNRIRLQCGVVGLYPSHKNYCASIFQLINTFAFAIIPAGIEHHPGNLANHIIEIIWPLLCDIHGPWLIPYYATNSQNPQTKTYLTPCPITFVEFYKKSLEAFLSAIQFSLQILPAGTIILNKVFHWYEVNFANPNVERAIIAAVHSVLFNLPWNRMSPHILTLENFHRIIMQFIPESHTFAGYIFINIDWSNWLQSNLHTLVYDTREKSLSILLTIMVKLSYEPTLRESPRLLTLLEEACNYPWHLVEYSSIEKIIDWFMLSTEPLVVLKLPSEHLLVDNAVLNLLASACEMTRKSDENGTSSLSQAKRALFVRTIARLIRACGAKYLKILSRQDGANSFHVAVISFLSQIEQITMDLYGVENQETITLLCEIFKTLQTQEVFISKLLIESMGLWLERENPGHVIIDCVFSAFRTWKPISLNSLILLELVLVNYFKTAPDSIGDTSKYTWEVAAQKVGPLAMAVNAELLIENNLLLCFHACAVEKFKTNISALENETFFQNVLKWLEQMKPSEGLEGKMVLVWGMAGYFGFILAERLKSCNNLLMLARHFQVVSNHIEGWKEGILGVIGIQRNSLAYRKYLLSRCLSCYIFSIVDALNAQTQKGKEYELALNEIRLCLTNRKYDELHPKLTSAIDIIEEETSGVTSLNDFNKTLCNLIRLFYDDNILYSVESFWSKY